MSMFFASQIPGFDQLSLTYAGESELTVNRTSTLALGPDGYAEIAEYGIIFSQAGLFQLIHIESLGLTVMSDTGEFHLSMFT